MRLKNCTAMLIYVDLSYNQIYIVMRKLIFTLFATLVGLAAYAADLTDDNPKPIKLIRGDNIIGRERSSFSSVSAVLYSGSGIIRLEMHNTGLGEVCIIDSSNRIVNQEIFTSDNDFCICNAPDESGIYTLVILCDNYHAEGNFIIE